MGQYLKHSPLQIADSVGMLLVLEDQDLIHSSFLVLLLTIYFLYGHLKGHWRPLTGESCGMRSQQTCSESFWSEGARLCQTALGWDTRAQSVTFPPQGPLTGHMARDIWPWKPWRNGHSSITHKALTTFSAPTIFSDSLSLSPLLLIFTHILQAGSNSSPVKIDQNSWEGVWLLFQVPLLLFGIA